METQELIEQQAEEGLQEQEESEQLDISEELTQTRQPKPIMSTPPVVKTPLYEEKNPKRDSEEATPSWKANFIDLCQKRKVNCFFRTGIHRGNCWDNKFSECREQAGHSLRRNTRNFHHKNGRKTTKCGSVIF